MPRISFTLLLLALSVGLMAQPTFKCGWNTYNTGSITHEFTYTCNFKDSIRLYLADSMVTFTSTDSAAILAFDYPLNDKSVNKKTTYLNAKKLVVKTEEFKDDNLLVLNEWKYDDKNRNIYHLEDNKTTGNVFKKNYEYVTEKKTGDVVVTESSHFNGRIEFYTKAYF